MTANRNLDAVYRHRRPDRVLFVPAIYDFKAKLADVPGHLFGLAQDDMIRALDREVDELAVDAVTVGYDIYNVEAEALGATVERSDRLAMPEIPAPLLSSLGDLSSLSVPAGPSQRMIILGETSVAAAKRYPEVSVRCGMSGPFSVAASLYPRDRLLMDLILDPAPVVALLEICTETIKLFLDAVADARDQSTPPVDVVLFDSFAAPPLLGPRQYETLVRPLHAQLIAYARGRGITDVSLVAGGDTRVILTAMEATGASSLLLDYTLTPEEARVEIENRAAAFRVNLSPDIIAHGSRDDILRHVDRLRLVLAECEYWVLGTGILPPDTPPAHVRIVADQINA